MKSLSAIIILVFSVVISVGQTSTSNLLTMKATDWNSVFDGTQPLVTQAHKFKGTPFLYEDYLPGSVYLSDSIHSPEKYKFKLNVQTNEIWMINDAGAEIILTNPRLLGLVLTKDGVKHSFKRLILPTGIAPTRKFVEMFYCGSMTLIKETQKQYLGTELGGRNSGILNGDDEETYETKEIYYLGNEHGNINKLRLKLADVFELFPSLVKRHKTNLENYCKSQNINRNLSETETIALLNYMSSIRSAE
jgi:hypothetical protein